MINKKYLKGIKKINIASRKCHNIHNENLADFPVAYKPKSVNQSWYTIWEKENFFKNKASNQKTFSMILPPPNVTGTLHLGHALTTTIQDILSRWHIMNGIPSAWIPGFDHAGIATQAVVEKYLYKTKKLKRTDMSKEEFLSVVNEWKTEKSNNIRKQLKDLGASLDWSNEYFTMSKHHNKAVNKAFVMLNEKKLLYRDKSLVNWSPSLGSAISEIEVEHETLTEKTDLELPGYKKKISFGQIYEINYEVLDSKEKIKVATTRPETILGDVALAVHPNDERYYHLIGKFAMHPLINRKLPIVPDSNVEMDFGSGVVKITPAHDNFDYAIAKKLNLSIIDVIDENGCMNENSGQYKGLPRFEARHKIVNDLSEKGAILSIKDHKMELPRCSRTGDVIELLLKDQWFIKCKDMAFKARKVVEDRTLKLNPSEHRDIWLEWLQNPRDWCVSRQLWWGHQIPAYFCEINNTQEWIISESKEEAIKIAIKKFGNNVKVTQDKDVLDTWFSSSLLPFSSMGWPEKTINLQNYYPLSLMESGHDILYLWIARMTMLGLELTGKLPFNEILLHGLLCDSQGKKMSKSSGNVLFPENIIDGISLNELNEQTNKSYNMGILNEKELKRTLVMNKKKFPDGIPECGVDALRFTLCSRNVKEHSVSFDIVECEQNKFFLNKIWQASKYVLLNTNKEPIQVPKDLTILDQWILSKLSLMVKAVNEAFNEHAFHKALRSIKEFVYNEFCDYYVEGTKIGFKSNNEAIINSHKFTLIKCLEVSLRILAPVTPYLSDELYSRLEKKLPEFNFDKSLLQNSYPTEKDFSHFRNTELENKMNEVIKIILSIRKLMGNISKKSNVKVHIVSDNQDDLKMIEENIRIISSISKLQNIQIFDSNTYTASKNSILDNGKLNCKIYLIIENDELFNKIKQNVEKRKVSKNQEKVAILQ